jgi:methylenetetrahydrofolate reductase (NADPH)
MFDEPFVVTVEVVPPQGPCPAETLSALESLAVRPFYGFSVASNPLAKARMSALALCALIRLRIGKTAILHVTTRDHNRLSLQGELWGARALGIETVLAASGDFMALGDRRRTTTVRDIDVYDLVRMARQAEMNTGVVFDAHPERGGLAGAVDHLKRKVAAGAQFAVTQPVFDRKAADELAEATRDVGIPVIMGLLPLRTARHAEFLNAKVTGIVVPASLRRGMRNAGDPSAAGTGNAREMLAAARERFGGVCIMPPFGHYEVLLDIL